MVQEKDGNKDRQKQGQGKGSREQKAGRSLGATKETERQKEANKAQRGRRSAGEWAPPSSAASEPGCALASSKPLLKLLRVEARRPAGRQPSWKAAEDEVLGWHAPRRVAVG